MKCPKCHFDNPEDTNYCGKCATPLPPSKEIPISQTETLQTAIKELTSGSTFAGRYQVIEELGKGGMGRVYKVFDTKIKEKIALKLVRADIAFERETIERFSNELKLARKIRHTNVCQMFDLGEAEGAHFITMEYVSGDDLKSMLRMMGQLSPGQAISIAKQVCGGLAEAHRLGVIHRDLKPQNIMIDREGNVRIMDFGIARSLAAKGITGAGIIIGTPEYMSPEQVEGKDVDPRSDLYSLGVILYEMATGRVPFEGDTPFTVGIKHKSERPQDPNELNPNLPDDLNRVILKCLEKEKTNRFQSAAELQAELAKIDKGIPVTQKKIPKPGRQTSRQITVTFKLKRFFWPAVVAVAVILIGLGAWRLFHRQGTVAAAKIENSIAVISFKNQTGDPAYDYLQEAVPNLLITNLENTGLFYVATWERMQDILNQMGVKQARTIDSDLGFKLCRREGIKAIAIGSFTKAGDVFRTDVKVLDAETKQILKSANIKGTGVDSILDSQIDSLSRVISLSLGIEKAKIEAAPLKVKDITTQSLQAYDYFLKGKEAYGLGYWTDVKNYMEKALKLDPSFAMAYLYMAWTYHHLNEIKARNETLEKAMAFSDRTSEKDRLYLDAAYANYVKDDGEKFMALMNELVQKYPKEEWAYYYLGDFLMEKKQDWVGAYGQFKKWLEVDPRDANAINHLLHVSVIMGDYNRAAEYIKMHDAIAPPDAYNLWQQAQMYLGMGQIDKAIAKDREALEIKPDFFYSLLDLAWFHALKEDYEESMKWMNENISRSTSAGMKLIAYDMRGFNLYWLGNFKQALSDFNMSERMAEEVEDWESKLDAVEQKGVVYLLQGELRLSQNCFEDVLRIAEKHFPGNVPLQRASLVLRLGDIALRQGQIGQANARLSELKSLLPTGDKGAQNRLISWHDLLRGEVLLAQGSLDEALSASAKACRENTSYWATGSWIFMDLLARIYAKKGEVGKAIAEYERLLNQEPSVRDYGIHPLFRYRLGLLYERAGETLKAKAQYDRFLVHWKDADPGQPEVEDARKRLAEFR